MRRMKPRELSLAMVAALSLPVTGGCQLLFSEALGGAALGALVGGLVGADGGRGFSGNGAAIGAGVGLAAGTLIGLSRSVQSEAVETTSAVQMVTKVSLGSVHGRHGSSGWMGYSATWVPGASCTLPAATGCREGRDWVWPATLAGAASGALIGAGTRSVGTGLAVGAAAGLVAGSVAEHQARGRAALARGSGPCSDFAVCPTARAQEVSAPPGLASPQAQITSRPGPTSTYYWTAPPTVPDAPVVPDAPRF